MIMKNKLFCALLLTTLTTSCTWVGTQKQVSILNQDHVVNSQDSFYLIYPKNGFAKTFFTKKLEENTKSAKEVVATLRTSLSEKLGELTISEENIDLEQGFKNAQMNGSKYLININIHQWKDASYPVCGPSTNRNGTLNETPTMDTVDLTLLVYDVKSRKLINKQKIENKGCPIVIGGVIPIGKNSPESRFAAMLPEWLNNIKLGNQSLSN